LESEKLVIGFARVHTFTCVIGVGSPAGARREKGNHRGQRRFRPMTGFHRRLRTINIAGSCMLKTVGARVLGESDRGSASSPGRRAGESPPPPPRRTPLDNRATSRGDGRVKRRAAAGSSAPGRTCQNADVQRDGGTPSPTGCRVWETTGPPSDAAGRWRSAHLMSALTRL